MDHATAVAEALGADLIVVYAGAMFEPLAWHFMQSEGMLLTIAATRGLTSLAVMPGILRAGEAKAVAAGGTRGPRCAPFS
jgi:hypothetical protein